VTRIAAVTWSQGASPKAIVDAFGAGGLSVAVLDALLEDPELKKKALVALTKGKPAGPAAKTS